MTISWAVVAFSFGSLALLHDAAASSCTSISDGSFSSQTTWNCGCDPATCDTLIVSHHLTLTVAYSIQAQHLTITSTGHISSSAQLWLEAELLNYGNLVADRLLLSPPGQLRNEGSINAEHFETNVCGFENLGLITAEDTLWMYCPGIVSNLGVLTAETMLLAIMTNEGAITAGRIHWGTMQNYGGIQARHADLSTGNLYNNGLFQSDTIHLANHIENDALGVITCDRFIQLANFENSGTLRVHGVWLNGGAGEEADSRLYLGSVNETRNFINAIGSELRGTSTLCILENSENHGLVSGPIGICDITSSSTTSPFMDVHDGDIQPPIFQCPNGPCGWTAIREEEYTNGTSLFPNPNEGQFMLQLGDFAARTQSLELHDAWHRVTWSSSGPFMESIYCALQLLPQGAYVLLGKDHVGMRLFSARVIIAK